MPTVLYLSMPCCVNVTKCCSDEEAWYKWQFWLYPSLALKFHTVYHDLVQYLPISFWIIRKYASSATMPDQSIRIFLENRKVMLSLLKGKCSHCGKDRMLNNVIYLPGYELGQCLFWHENWHFVCLASPWGTYTSELSWTKNNKVLRPDYTKCTTKCHLHVKF